jgi:hypothetical protein
MIDKLQLLTSATLTLAKPHSHVLPKSYTRRFKAKDQITGNEHNYAVFGSTLTFKLWHPSIIIFQE